MNDLDDLGLYERLDPGGMGALIAGFADQCRTAWRNVRSLDLPPSYRGAQNVLVLGMGGSAIGGDLLRTLVAAECRVPILVSREYSVPAWVDGQTLAVAMSHSGNTEETLSALERARSLGAMIVGVTTGGDMARATGLPLLRYAFEGQPRAALGFSFVSLLGIVARMSWIADPANELDEALTRVGELGEEIGTGTPSSHNPAKQLAHKLFDCIPVIYGGGVMGEVAHRWKTQINENAKMTAIYDLMSELNHNAVVGYEFPQSALRNLVFVLLLSKRADMRIQKRFEVTGELLTRRALEQEVIEVRGNSLLGEMLWTIHFGDYVSYYLAMLNGVDPTPVAAIDFLKNALKR